MTVNSTAQSVTVNASPGARATDQMTEHLQRSPSRQMRLLDQADGLKVLRCGEPHVWSPPFPIMLFLSSRNSSACSATTSFKSCASRLSCLTSSVVAARAVSPASRACRPLGTPSTKSNTCSRLRISTIVTTRSDASRPSVPIDRDQCEGAQTLRSENAPDGAAVGRPYRTIGYFEELLRDDAFAFATRGVEELSSHDFLFLELDQARQIVTAWVADYNQEAAFLTISAQPPIALRYLVAPHVARLLTPRHWAYQQPTIG